VLSKSLAALLLGMPLAVSLVGLLALWGPGALPERTLPALLLFFPVWVACICVPFWFRSGRGAWLWMGGLTVLGFGLIHLARGALKGIA
jgi:hypothetical protein